MGTPNLYEVLGVAKDADQDEIKKAFRKKAISSHSDHEGGSDEKFRLVRLAHDVLIDPARRKLYDETGSVEQSNKSIDMQKSLAVFVAGFMDGSITDFLLDPRKHLIEMRDKIEVNLQALKDNLENLEEDFEKLKDEKDMEELLFLLEMTLSTRKEAVKGGEMHYANCKKLIAQLDLAVEKLGRGSEPLATRIIFNFDMGDISDTTFGGSGNAT